MKPKKIISLISIYGLVFMTATVQAQTSNNGLAEFFSVNSFANPGGSSNYVSGYTGSFANGVTWSLTGTDANAGDGLPGGLINPYNALIDGFGNTTDNVANGVGPWQNPLIVQDGAGASQSVYNAWGAWATGGGVDYIGQSAQTYESAVDYTMTFSSPLTEIYLYVREIDDGQMSLWNYAPTVVQTASYTLGSVIYDSTNNIVRDWSNTGEGIDLNSPGIPFFDYIFGNPTNPSAAGVLKFSDPAGISSLSWRTELIPAGGQSDGFQIAFATSPVPEPSGVLLLGVTGVLGLLRRRRA